MKCDELKSFIVRYNGEFIRAYNETEVDETIAELKEFIEDACLERDDNQAAIDELNAELESLKATHYTESVDAGMRERRLKRALWLARATIANSTKYKYHRLACKAEIDPQPHGWSCYINGEVYRTGKMNRKLEPYYWTEIWGEVERKCRAKAEEYK